MRITTAGLFTFFVAASAQVSGLTWNPCSRSYKVKSGDTCNSIAQQNGAPTYQIICENEDINGECTNLGVGEEICLGREGLGGDCKETHVVKWPDTVQSIADRYLIPLKIFDHNNHCFGGVCPPFSVWTGMVVCVSRYEILHEHECNKILSQHSMLGQVPI